MVQNPAMRKFHCLSFPHTSIDPRLFRRGVVQLTGDQSKNPNQLDEVVQGRSTGVLVSSWAANAKAWFCYVMLMLINFGCDFLDLHDLKKRWWQILVANTVVVNDHQDPSGPCPRRAHQSSLPPRQQTARGDLRGNSLTGMEGLFLKPKLKST